MATPDFGIFCQLGPEVVFCDATSSPTTHQIIAAGPTLLPLSGAQELFAQIINSDFFTRRFTIAAFDLYRYNFYTLTMAPTNLPTMAAPQAQKTMSSRLMTMKFMQRAAATAATAPPTDKTSTPKADDEGPSKRRKHSHTSKTTTSNPEADQALFDQKAIQAALEEEEKKRQAAIEKRAAELGDSHWVLPGASVTPKAGARPVLNVVQVGFAQIDYSGDASDDDNGPATVPTTARLRQSNMKKKKACLLTGLQVWSHALT